MVDATNHWIPLTDKDGKSFEFNDITGEIRYPEDDKGLDVINDLFGTIDDMLDQGDSFDAEGQHFPRGSRPAWDAKGRYLSLGDEPEPLETCPDCKGSGKYQGLGAPEYCQNCNGLGQV